MLYVIALVVIGLLVGGFMYYKKTKRVKAKAAQDALTCDHKWIIKFADKTKKTGHLACKFCGAKR